MNINRGVLTTLFSAFLVVIAIIAVSFTPAYAASKNAPIAQTTPTTATGTVTNNANLRSGPGTNFSRVGSARAGQRVTITGSAVTSAGVLWYRLEGNTWIAGFLVTSVRVVATPTATSTPVRFSTAGMTPATVTRIVDGDTIDVLIGSTTFRVRYIGMDTPERGENFFAEAAAVNRRLVFGKTVYMEKDVSSVDRYDRLLRYIYLADGTFVNAELVRLGMAVASTYPPDVKYQDTLGVAQQEAVEAGVGMWVKSITATASGPVNLRGGPGTNYPVIGSAGRGQSLDIIARNQAGNWLQMSNSSWIFASLVTDAPINLPIAQNIPAPPVVAPVAAPNRVVPAQPTARPANCDPSYPTVCIPPAPPDLDCGEIPYRRFTVIGADPHRFDGDKDGVGCER